MTAPEQRALATGAAGLIGSEIVDYFCRLGWTVQGFDRNMRADFFGEAGGTSWNPNRLLGEHDSFRRCDLDVRDRDSVEALAGSFDPQLVVHAAAQPSDDLAASRPFEDLDSYAVGVQHLLEVTRRHGASDLMKNPRHLFEEIHSAVKAR